MNENSTYIIGEIGQNHNGSADIAKLLIEIASRPVVDTLFGEKLKGMDAVKLVKRDLDHELTKSQMEQIYNSPHSFGLTYGEHRRYLELSDEEHFDLYTYAKSKSLDLVETICAIQALSILKLFNPDRLKIASRDLTNLPLIEAMAETKIPIILSTGMTGEKELSEALEVITKYHNNISILHCVSEYPTQYKNVNLNSIKYLKKKYPYYDVGYSDHTIGIATPVAAVALGATIIEKHITIDRKMKGTDQAGSLSIEGIERMVRDIRNLEFSLGKEELHISNDVRIAKEKLERSIATIENLSKGHLLRVEDIQLLSPGTGLKWSEKDCLLGKRLRKAIIKDELIYLEDVE
ncbi:MAG TPA: shikimate dehydrogenase [Candidatus Methanofastidiosum sp.]|nr:shikimate dehydrogenase [Methanofastidiosum sp.]